MSNPERVNIFVDGEFYCGIDGFHLYGLGLRKGAELSELLEDDPSVIFSASSKRGMLPFNSIEGIPEYSGMLP